MRSERFDYDLERRRRLWARRMVSHSKYADRVAGRNYNENTYITAIELKSLRKKQKNRCCYCDVSMQTYNRSLWNGLTIERIDSSLPHASLNCRICCHTCNCKRFDKKNITLYRNRKYLQDRKRQAKAVREVLCDITKFHDSRRSCFA